MAAEVSAQLQAWWAAPAQLPPLPALAAAQAAAAHGAGAAAAAAGGGGGALAALPQPPQPRRAALLQLLVGGFLPLTTRDLEEWQAEGEVWAHARADAAASCDASSGLHACCQQLVLSLVLADKGVTAPVLVTLLKGVSALVPPGWGAAAGAGEPTSSHHHHHHLQQQQQQQLPGPSILGPCGVAYPCVLLLKEVVWEAVALNAYELHDALDYSAWLHSALLPEMLSLQQQQLQQQQGQQQQGLLQQQQGLLQQQQQQQQQHAPLPLLPRAAARVVGQWVAGLKPDDRPAAYAGLTTLLVQPGRQPQAQHAHSGSGSSSGSPDVVLQLAAVGALRSLIDDFGFEGQQLLPVLPALVGALTRMVRESGELDTQTQV
jgi:hypothetical protein